MATNGKSEGQVTKRETRRRFKKNQGRMTPNGTRTFRARDSVPMTAKHPKTERKGKGLLGVASMVPKNAKESFRLPQLGGKSL